VRQAAGTADAAGGRKKYELEWLTSLLGADLATGATGEYCCFMSEPDLSLEFGASSFGVRLDLNFVAALVLKWVEDTALIPAADEFSITREYKIGVGLLRVGGMLAGHISFPFIMNGADADFRDSVRVAVFAFGCIRLICKEREESLPIISIVYDYVLKYDSMQFGASRRSSSRESVTPLRTEHYVQKKNWYASFKT
jgi:hypothetical protein